jgi:hypothetical protein
MPYSAAAVFEAGRRIVGEFLEPHGFEWRFCGAGPSSGGHFAVGEFVRADRVLELHFRESLGMVQYHIGEIVISHEDYMRHTGHKAEACYPGFSSDPLDGFRHLVEDLLRFGRDFTEGSGQTLIAARSAADAYASVPGFSRLGSNDP